MEVSLVGLHSDVALRHSYYLLLLKDDKKPVLVVCVGEKPYGLPYSTFPPESYKIHLTLAVMAECRLKVDQHQEACGREILTLPI